MSVTGPTDNEIVEALQRLVEDGISAGTYVILEGDPGRSYYIQFALDGGRLYCEAVSNQYLEPANQLDEEQLRTLENLGWREPEHDCQNWFRTFRPTRDEEFQEIVDLVHRAFAEIYAIAADTPLEMKCSWDGEVIGSETKIRFASEAEERGMSEAEYEAEVQAVDEAIARMEREGWGKVVERPEGQTRVMFVGKEGLERVKKALGRE
jgi:hypothetical protein